MGKVEIRFLSDNALSGKSKATTAQMERTGGQE
jgi:hypothetical protein